jgi:endonuclease/exonuclease/phosphatase family metal-dependent hydrolase
LIFGDFNIMLNNEEKFGGNLLNHNITSSFRNILSLCDLQDLGYSDNKYTWTNKHPGDNLILARLDQFLATSDWKNRFTNHTNHHLLRFKSDHNPILLDFSASKNDRMRPKEPKLRRFEQIWTRNEDHINRVKTTWCTSHGHLDDRLKYTLNALHNWGTSIFGILPRQIKKAQKDLMELQQMQGSQDLTQQINDKEIELDKLLDGEEMWWKQRSRADWFQHGDKNTKFFHMKASQRKKKNTIKGIRDNQGVLQTTHEKIEETLLEHFQLLFQSQPTQQINETVHMVKDKLNNEMRNFLSVEFH